MTDYGYFLAFPIAQQLPGRIIEKVEALDSEGALAIRVWFTDGTRLIIEPFSTHQRLQVIFEPNPHDRNHRLIGMLDISDEENRGARWTKTPPSAVGVYWYTHPAWDDAATVEVILRFGRGLVALFPGDDDATPLDQCTGVWWPEPLVAPELPRGGDDVD